MPDEIELTAAEREVCGQLRIDPAAYAATKQKIADERASHVANAARLTEYFKTRFPEAYKQQES